MPVDIAIEDDGWAVLPGLELIAEQAFAAALPKGEQGKIITLLFADDETMQDLNKEWRGLDKPTNVLSFPAPKNQPVPTGELPLLGDIVLGFGTCKREAEAAGKTLGNHTCHLIVHGILHILGYDHENDKDAEIMEAAEIKILSTLGIENPYLS
jgi:probable rRNA maturation factor